ncbi:hypothetical protein [Candidatus Pantoea floridensis]|uniref:hypothetical protein n=1 Tax=Candidatus Pantoea floridensis TaxID=1938870 RepID=UPI000BE46A03|nr:hypothetical protein [Pantoea floridensis]
MQVKEKFLRNNFSNNLLYFFKTKWIKYVVPSAVVTVAIATGINAIHDSWSMISNVFRPEPLKVINARLQPFRISPLVRHSVDDAFLILTVRNYGKEPLMLISADADIVGGMYSGKGKAGSQGKCVFGADANVNTPLTIRPGDTVEIEIGGAIRLENLHNLMDLLPASQIHVFLDDPIGIHETFYVDYLNKIFENYYGAHTEVVANLFTGESSDKHTFNFKLSQGKDLFSKDGHLHHDWLIARWLGPPLKMSAQKKDDCT